MKISLALGPRRTLSRQTAWGCLTTNLALPGFGSLAAGRPVGYPQAALTLGGFALTVIFFVRFFVWYQANSARLQNSDDPVAKLAEMWLAMRWAVLGMALFAVSLLWALSTSLAIVRSAKQAEPPKVPPRLS